ncbi:hypothetical protein F5Y18DRAFT_429753 [Xylariaceae sp. FL1019]|nr:hypothetical protein F5Y18DRAFT_429753 [Xylariaceae sp. FL1019]
MHQLKDPLRPITPCMQQKHRPQRSTLRELNRIFTSLAIYKRSHRTPTSTPPRKSSNTRVLGTKEPKRPFLPTLSPIEEEKIEEPQPKDTTSKVSKPKEKKSAKWVVRPNGIQTISPTPTQSTSMQNQEILDRSISEKASMITSVECLHDKAEAVPIYSNSNTNSTNDSDCAIISPSEESALWSRLLEQEKEQQARKKALRDRQNAQLMRREMLKYYHVERTDVMLQRERTGLNWTLEFPDDSNGGFYMSTDEPRIVSLPDVVRPLRSFEGNVDVVRRETDFARGFSGIDVLAKMLGHLQT